MSPETNNPVCLDGPAQLHDAYRVFGRKQPGSALFLRMMIIMIVPLGRAKIDVLIRITTAWPGPFRQLVSTVTPLLQKQQQLPGQSMSWIMCINAGENTRIG